MTPGIIAYYDYLLLLPYIVIFFFIARRFAKKNAETSNEVYLLLLNWWIKMLAGILYAWMFVYYYNGSGDPFGYKNRSNELLDSILKDWQNIKYIFLPVQSFRDYIASQGYSNVHYLTVDFAYYTENNFMPSRISCFIALFTFNRFLIISLLFANLSYYGFVYIYTASKKFIKNYNKELIIGCLFIPSCLFWSSGIAKEPVCMIALGIMFTCMVKIFIQKKLRIGTIFFLLFFSFILYTVKSYIFFCFLFAFICWSLYRFANKLLSKNALFKAVSIGFFVMIAGGLVYLFAGSFQEFMKDQIGGIISNNIDAYEYMASGREGGGSLISVKDIDVSSVGGILKFIPRGMVNVFFRPFPWEISNVLMIFTVLENLFFIYLFFRVLIRSRFYTRQLFINKNYQVFAVVFSITLAFAIAISTFNFGTMVRYKMPFLPFWASFLLIINKKLSGSKEAAQG